MGKMDNVCIVIPAYNEEENISLLIKQWYPVIEKVGNQSLILVVDDGSKDETRSILFNLSKQYKNLRVVSKPNEGHGKAIRYGYEKALSYKTDYIFQIDSDRQTEPDEFWDFWKERNNHSVIIGHRKKRQDGISRKVVTLVLRLLIYLFFHIDVKDANTPFRLMKRECLERYLSKIPEDFNLTNVLLSIYFVFYKENIIFIPITFKPRQGGVNSINIKKIIGIGIQTYDDFKKIRKNLLNKKEKKWHLVIYSFLLAFLVITFCSKCSFLYPMNDGNDMNAYFTVGKSIKHGLIPYKDLFEQKGPFIYAIYFMGSLFSETSFIGIYLIEILFFTFFLYYSSKIIGLFLRREYIYMILPLFATFVATNASFFHGGSAEEFALPFLMYSFYHLLVYLKTEKELPFSVLLKNGLAAGFIFMIKYNLLGFHFAFCIFLLLDFLIKNRRISLKICFSFLAGMLIPFLFFSIYFLCNHAFREFIDTYFIFNIFGYSTGLPLHLKWMLVKEEFITIFSNNIFAFLILWIGFLYFFLHKKIFRSFYKIVPIFTFLMLLLGVYCGGRTYIYYYLVAMPFYLLGIIAIPLFIEEYYKKIPSFVLMFVNLLSFYFCFQLLLSNPNFYFSRYRKQNLVQYQFADIIKKDKDPSFMEYQCLDNGFYFTTNKVPNERYFISLNVIKQKYPNIFQDQTKRIKEKKVNFVILKKQHNSNDEIPEIITQSYKLVKKEPQIYENELYLYFLFKKK